MPPNTLPLVSTAATSATLPPATKLLKNVHIRTERHDSVRTPEDLYGLLDEEFRFDFDPCPFVPEGEQPAVDGLSVAWGRSTFVNPPFSCIRPWVEKAVREAREGKTVVMLVTARTNTNYWHELIIPCASEVRFLRGKVNFPGYAGRGGLPIGIAIVVFRGCDKDETMTPGLPGVLWSKVKRV